MYRTSAEGRPVMLNANLESDDRCARLDGYYHPYHRRLDYEIARAPEAMVLAIHSFTPLYEGKKRWMDIGLLFYKDTDLAEAVAEQFRSAGLKVGLNEPYSGANGEMYSAYRHGMQHGRHALELEFCQALSGDEAEREKLIEVTASALRAVGVVP
jgi:predicted N-formylglutamate amidohydrolase